MAALRQFEQRLAQCLKRFCLAAEFFRAGDGECLHFGAGALAVAPQPEEIANILDRKAEVARIGDEAQAVDIGIGLIAIAAVPARRRRDQADLLIMADHPLRDAARLRGRADIHSFTRLRRSALATMLTDDSAIAAAAIIGESRMPKTG